MEPFQTVKSVPTPFLRNNIDTDVIISSRYLKTVSRLGLGEGTFAAVRFLDDGSPDPDCVFNQPRFSESRILVTGDNFGCGSSREHALWGLSDLGYRCIIAPGFADIFASNAYKNGILTVVLDRAQVERIAAEGEAGHEVLVDLPNQNLRLSDGTVYDFSLDPFRRKCLLEGLDEVGLTLKDHGEAIAAFEAQQKQQMSWLYR
ncbi:MULTISPECIES: 3-isopropylmalate dehydratase small subunit [unclassified Iodidimonas]|jgi:3-isopropylmalate/(R)-2-methylmalate dehydratase small subunit|uniref:3-isopropylmalate dehydratase small subunit n=1 Tax=unclassified Iodidimonas TaxID=2626145 RepID=UPI00248229B5|nr:MULTISPECIES: 3-isopropylmalate dehydratase small subunit [unclassified Iodidimonas]